RGSGRGEAQRGRQSGDQQGRQAQGEQHKGRQDRQAEDKQQKDRQDRQAQDKQQKDRQDRRAEDKQQKDRQDRQAQDKQQKDRQDRQAQDKQQKDRQDRQAQDKQRQDQQNRQAQDKQRGPQAGQGRDGNTVASEPANWNEQQRREVRDVFRRDRQHVRHHTNVNVDIAIGRRLPRTLSYYRVPSFVVDLAPRYRGYRYAWIGDRYCIVDPQTYEIVAYVDDDTGVVYASSGSSASGRGGGEGGRGPSCEVSFNEAQQRRLLTEIETLRPQPLPDLRVGIDLPGNVELHVFPTRLRRDFDRLDGCRYVALSPDRIAIVEPSTRRVVAIVDRR
ncbi:MAG: DUF1236 domain-containing protein, partial [Hyphomicrobiaceae bacterium]